MWMLPLYLHVNQKSDCDDYDVVFVCLFLLFTSIFVYVLGPCYKRRQLVLSLQEAASEIFPLNFSINLYGKPVFITYCCRFTDIKPKEKVGNHVHPSVFLSIYTV